MDRILLNPFNLRFENKDMTKQFLAAIVLSILVLTGTGNAEIVEKTGTFGGMGVDYLVALPDDFDPANEYPAVLAFGGGGQTMRITRNALENHWAMEAGRQGYIVVSPAAPMGQLYFRAGAAIVPALLDQILDDYNVENNKFHITGRSNGGLSAFHVAATYPEYFRSLTGFPGLLQDANRERVAALTGMCIYMHVGELDAGWRQAMVGQAELLRDRGFRVQFAVEEGMGHGLDSLTGDGSKRLFEHFKDSAANCE